MTGRVARYAFAHRGGRAHGRDNTMATFREALARGATGLETDAWITADGQVVLDHDGVHRAARRRHKPMADVVKTELPDHIPTLDELYAACGTDFDLAVDVRLPDVAAAVVAVAQAHSATARLWLVAGATRLLPAWRMLDQRVHLAHTVDGHRRGRSVISEAQAAGADAVNLRWPWWTRRLVQHVHDAGLLAFAYDAQTTWSLRRALQQGCDGVFSDHVDRMVAALGARPN